MPELVYTTPEPGATIVKEIVVAVQINFLTGVTDLRVARLDSNGNQVNVATRNLTLDQTTLDDIAGDLLTQAESSGAAPDGSIT